MLGDDAIDVTTAQSVLNNDKFVRDSSVKQYLVKFSGMRVPEGSRKRVAEQIDLDSAVYVHYNAYIVSCTDDEAVSIANTPGMVFLQYFI